MDGGNRLSTTAHGTVFHYQLWNHRITSDFDLGELDPATWHSGSDTLSIHRIPLEDCTPPAGPVVFENRLEDGQVWFTAWSIEGGYLVQFPGLCAFRIFPEQMRIDCAPEPEVPDSSVAHMILDHAIPRLFSLKPGYLVFHACAIQMADKVVAVIGQSGQGKSTLAAWFAAQGFPLLTDDCLVVRWDEGAGQWLAQPSYQSVRLWPDSVRALGIPDSELREFAGYTTKKRTGREVDFRFASKGAPLAGCFVLPQATVPGKIHPAHVGSPQIEPMVVNDAFVALVGAVFRTDPQNVAVNRREFEVLTSLTNSVWFWTLRYERDYGRLPEVRAAMLNAMRADDSTKPTTQNRDPSANSGQVAGDPHTDKIR